MGSSNTVPLPLVPVPDVVPKMSPAESTTKRPVGAEPPGNRNSVVSVDPPDVGMVKSVPPPVLPAADVVPYKVLPRRVKPPSGFDPLVPTKLVRSLIVPLPLLRAKTVPVDAVPPELVVPNRSPPASIAKAPCGLAHWIY